MDRIEEKHWHMILAMPMWSVTMWFLLTKNKNFVHRHEATGITVHNIFTYYSFYQSTIPIW